MIKDATGKQYESCNDKYNSEKVSGIQFQGMLQLKQAVSFFATLLREAKLIRCY
jgi:hypothetical protein